MSAARLATWDDDACRCVHEATLEVLAETGIEVRYARRPYTRRHLRQIRQSDLLETTRQMPGRPRARRPCSTA